MLVFAIAQVKTSGDVTQLHIQKIAIISKNIFSGLPKKIFRPTPGNIDIKIKSSLSSHYYAKACNQCWGPSPRLSGMAKQPRRNIASDGHTVSDLTDLVNEPKTSCTDSYGPTAPTDQLQH